MEVILDCFFENFAQLERDNLHARYKRRDMVEYFNTLIEGCRLGSQCTGEESCRTAIDYIVRFHSNSMKGNGNICLMGKYHNILYIALQLCYHWQLKDTATIVALLDQIYRCEKTFERLWVGAIFGTRAPHFIAGWKSDFRDQEENLRAVVFYLNHATKGRLAYRNEEGALIRFVDIPLECCGKATPLKILVQLGLSDKLHILLRFGATVNGHMATDGERPIEMLLERLNEFDHKYPYNLIDCLCFILRSEPQIQFENGREQMENIAGEKYLKLIEDGIIPLRRCGIVPVELKHLCRCAIRHRLWENYQLPQGIRTLPIPENLHKYLDLLCD